MAVSGSPREWAGGTAAGLRPSAWRAFKSAAWLGWEMESNWAQPAVFLLYSVIRPLGAVGIVVFMTAVVHAARVLRINSVGRQPQMAPAASTESLAAMGGAL